MQTQPPIAEPRILVIGYGNPGRQDDGLGPECARRIEAWQLGNITTQDNYQLSVEDAYDIAQYDTVVFVDASIEAIDAFSFSPITGGGQTGFGSHSLTPSAVVELSRTLFQVSPAAFLLGIRGFEFDRFEEKLSDKAEQNLQTALAFLSSWLKDQACA